ncbi:MAG TPA: redoxin family protein [Parvularculaceae bacterium]|nr:redoxin family protein [Parvularculaceae bacterium]
MAFKPKLAPTIKAAEWLNTEQSLQLEAMRGKVILIEAFQMLCPGCVSHGLPQAMRVYQTFKHDDVQVIGLHTVFEHQEAQGTKSALKAFLHEYKITFPVAIDAPSEMGGIPKTMSTYQMQGTPTLILIDRNGYLRKQKFGMEQDLMLGAEIMALMCETDVFADSKSEAKQANHSGECDKHGCSL